MLNGCRESAQRFEDAGHACPVRLGVAAVTGGADERGISAMPRETRGDAVSAREGSAGPRRTPSAAGEAKPSRGPKGPTTRDGERPTRG